MSDQPRPGRPADQPPGLSQITYRSGTYGTFLRDMHLAVGREGRYLRDLDTRAPDDPAMALLDAWAVAGDVLSFAAERIANEAYLGTATERRSVRALARLLDYELRPGKAAETWLAFTLEGADGAPEVVPIPVGTRVSSIPGPGEQMVHFETVEALEAHPWLGAMRPRRSRPQRIDDVTAARAVLAEGTRPEVRRGDWLLVPDGGDGSLRRVEHSEPDAVAGTTRISYDVDAPVVPILLLPQFLAAPITYTVAPFGLSAPFLASEVHGTSRSQRSFEATLVKRRVSANVLRGHLSTAPPPPPAEEVLRFRSRAAVFGHNTPPTDGGDSQIPSLGAVLPTSRTTVSLDREYPEVRRRSRVAFVSGSARHVAEVTDVSTRTDQRKRLVSRVTRVTFTPRLPPGWMTYSTADVVVLVDSEVLPLAPLPVTTPVDGSSILLDAYYPDVAEGRPVAVTGERTDLAGVEETSVHVVKSVTLEDGLTRLDLETALPWPLTRPSLRIDANLAKATHGESVSRPIGHGDASLPGQRFRLPVAPLTHVAAPTTSGVAPELEVRVDGVVWTRLDSLRTAGPLDRVYTLTYREDGSVVVVTGDGVHGRRVPPGIDNVVATWRVGLGSAGMVRAGQLSLLADKPQGVRAVTNPLAAVGAVEGQSADDARTAAPASVLTLGRIVTLRDYANFARGFAGITKAHAAWVWSGSHRSVFLTVAGVDGALVPDGDLTILRQVVAEVSDPATGLTIAHFRPAWFHVEAGIALLPGYDPAVVHPRVEAALRARFGFAARALGQPVARSEVIETMQAVEGVDWVDVDAFRRGADGPDAQVLPAAMPRSGRRVARLGLPEGAELLALDPDPLSWRTIA